MEHVRTEMLDYSFAISISASHPTEGLSVLESVFGIQAGRWHKPQKGNKKRGVSNRYYNNFWQSDIETAGYSSFGEFLTAFSQSCVFENTDKLIRLVESGGRITLCVVVFLDGCFADEIDYDVLRVLANAGMSLRIDAYPPDDD